MCHKQYDNGKTNRFKPTENNRKHENAKPYKREKKKIDIRDYKE
jgi:hypothetical protein